MNLPQINIETLVLVAVWNKPAIFQGCFKISPINSSLDSIFLFFRCEFENTHRKDHVDEDFSPDEYEFSHLYHESHLIIHLETETEMGYAEYILKYALYKTLLEMRTNPKHGFISIDDIAMEAIIKKVEPILQKNGALKILDEFAHIGFAVSMDFYPQEEMGQLAVKNLLNIGTKGIEHQ